MKSEMITIRYYDGQTIQFGDVVNYHGQTGSVIGIGSELDEQAKKIANKCKDILRDEIIIRFVNGAVVLTDVDEDLELLHRMVKSGKKS
jgi:hypothetical protein